MIITSNIPERGVRMGMPPGVDHPDASRVQSGFLSHVVAMWHAVLNFVAPFGFEDETGFHYGEMPASRERQQTTHLR